MKLLKKQGMNLCFAVIVAVLAAMPLLLQSGVLTASSTILYLGKCIAFAIVAMGLDLIWGYTGILSLDITLSTTESSVEPKNAPPTGDKIVEWTQHDYSNDWDYVNPDGSLG